MMVKISRRNLIAGMMATGALTVTDIAKTHGLTLHTRKLRRITQDELNEAVASHQKWLTKPDAGSPLTLTGCDASGLIVRDANLTGANLFGARMINAQFYGVNLSNVAAANCYLDGNIFEECILASANFIGASLRYARIVSDEHRRALNYVISIYPISLQFARLGYCDLTGAIIRASLDGSFFNDANLEGADLRNCRSHYIGPVFNRANLKETILTGSSFGIADFIDANAPGVRMDRCHIDSGSFLGANLRNASFADTKFRQVEFSNSDLSSADFTQSTLSDFDSDEKSSELEGLRGSNPFGCKIDGALINGHRQLWPDGNRPLAHWEKEAEEMPVSR